ncbi:organic cation transporter protein-like isoform X1 [Dreissena polymorpha]|nr:organic cation transporter protein-like isoform X1 [Dreissena polymorpha]XP_052244560.1 organic cation transporter protein-like isoform X1 [Dreissena polymorpha]
MKFDNITIVLGEFGKYQRILYVCVCVPIIFTAIQILASVFTLALPKHRCTIPSLENDTYEVQGIWHDILINKYIPRSTDGSLAYAACAIYLSHANTSYNEQGVPLNSSTAECDSWVYEKATFKSTFFTKINLVCGEDLARANANMALLVGHLVGAVSIGLVSDMFGRKKALVVAIVFFIVAAFGTAFARTYEVFVGFRFMQGVANLGMYTTLFVIGLELVGPSYRVAAGIIINFFWCFGLYALCLIAFLVRSWYPLQLALACPSVILILHIWLLPESPRWLMSKGRFQEANRILHKCAKVNGVTLPDELLSNDIDDNTNTSQSVLKMFTVPRLLLRTLIIYFNWMVVNIVYYGLSLNVGNLSGDIYVNFTITSTMELGAYIMCLLLLNKVGRKSLHAGTMILGGVSCLCTIFSTLYAPPEHAWITVVLANVGKFGISAAFAIIYVWSSELFPTLVRHSGIGSSSMVGIVGTILSPYTMELGNLIPGNFGKALPLIIFGGLSVAAGMLSLLLPETKGAVLPESVRDAEKFGRQSRLKRALTS